MKSHDVLEDTTFSGNLASASLVEAVKVNDSNSATQYEMVSCESVECS